MEEMAERESERERNVYTTGIETGLCTLGFVSILDVRKVCGRLNVKINGINRELDISIFLFI